MHNRRFLGGDGELGKLEVSFMYLIVIDPDADRGQAILRLPMIKAHMNANNLPYEVCIAAGFTDGYWYVTEFCKRNSLCSGIIGMGGDEIVQEIITGLLDSYPESRNGEKIPIPLGILPSHFGNNFASSFEGNKIHAQSKSNQAPEKVVKHFFDVFMGGKTREVDVVTTGDMGFINIGNIGLDAVIARDAEALKPRFDDYCYFVAGIKTIMKYRATPYTIEIIEGRETEKISGDFLCVVVCNGRYYGTGMHVAPEAVIDDGKITLGLVSPMNRLRTMTVMSALMNESYPVIKEINFKTCDELKLTTSPGIYCLDGNIYRHDGEIVFKVLPRILDLFY